MLALPMAAHPCTGDTLQVLGHGVEHVQGRGRDVTAAPMGAGGGEEINTLQVLGKVALRRQSSTADPSSRPTADQPRIDRFSADSGHWCFAGRGPLYQALPWPRPALVTPIGTNLPWLGLLYQDPATVRPHAQGAVGWSKVDPMSRTVLT